MSSGHDRRTFFRELLRGASRAASEVEALRRAADDAVRRSVGRGEAADDINFPRPAGASSRLATLDDLRGLCAELGRGPWGDEAAALARTSIRLTHGGDGASWLGGGPRAVFGEWPAWDGTDLALVARIALDELPPCPLPASGVLLVFFALARAPSGLRPSHAGACRVIHTDAGEPGDAEVEAGLPRIPLLPSAELTLPDAPAAVDDLMDLEEWTDLRERLASFQGVELDDCAPEYQALHRLLGHPDTFAAEMDLEAELVSRGVDLEEAPNSVLPESEHGSTSPRWTLLFQLSSDAEVGVALDPGSRLFVWIREDDLRVGRFDRVRAFVR